MKITYIERRFIDRYTCIDKIKTVSALSSFTTGGLTYLKLNAFNYLTIDTDMIINIDKEGM